MAEVQYFGFVEDRLVQAQEGEAAKRGDPVQGSSIAGSLSSNQFCITCIGRIDFNEYGLRLARIVKLDKFDKRLPHHDQFRIL